MPNADHTLRNSDAVQSTLAYFQTLVQNKPRPRFSWQLPADGSIQVHVTDTPTDVKLWKATNPKTRDFRLMTIGPTWTSEPLTAANGIFTARVPKPESGWTAFFVELSYPGAGSFPMTFTTQVRVIPDVYPFPPPKLTPPVSAAASGGAPGRRVVFHR